MPRVTLIEGDGIGPEVVASARRVIEAAGADIQWEPVAVGIAAKENFGEALPQQPWNP
jgi:isocitrate/isopropylmalate dehydrogenase